MSTLRGWIVRKLYPELEGDITRLERIERLRREAEDLAQRQTDILRRIKYIEEGHRVISRAP